MIQAKASELVSAAKTRLIDKNTTDEAVVQIKAEEATQLRLGHLQTISRGHNLCQALLFELETQTFDFVLIGRLGDLMHSPDESGTDRLSDIYKKG